MAHMQPEVWYGGMWICETLRGETFYYPDDVFVGEDIMKECSDAVSTAYEKGWWARLSAPGYMDATDWSGPFSTQREAYDHLFDTYDIDSKGDDRGEGGWNMDDDFEDDEELHGLGQPSDRRNRRVHNLYQTEDGRWVFRYGVTPYSFEGEKMFFAARDEAVRTAMRHGWIVKENNRLRKPVSAGINGVDDDDGEYDPRKVTWFHTQRRAEGNAYATSRLYGRADAGSPYYGMWAVGTAEQLKELGIKPRSRS